MVYSNKRIIIILVESFVIVSAGLVMGFVKNSLSQKCLILFDSGNKVAACDSGLSGKEAKRFFDSLKVIFVDSRTPLEYRDMHIFGALNLPYDEYDNVILRLYPKLHQEKVILTYCSESGCDSALKLADRLKSDGYKNVRVYPGGIDEWTREGFPVTEGDPEWLFEENED